MLIEQSMFDSYNELLQKNLSQKYSDPVEAIKDQIYMAYYAKKVYTMLNELRQEMTAPEQIRLTETSLDHLAKAKTLTREALGNNRVVANG